MKRELDPQMTHLVHLDDFPAKVAALSVRVRDVAWEGAPWPVVEIEQALNSWTANELVQLVRCLEVHAGLGFCASTTRALTRSLVKGKEERILAALVGLRVYGHMWMAMEASRQER